MPINQIAYLPYLPKLDLTFGNITLLPFEDERVQSRLSDEQKSYLSWYFAKYITLTQKPLNITIASFAGEILRDYSENEQTEFYDTMSCLSVLYLWDNFIFSPVSSDNFQLFIKNFNPNDSKSLATTTGSFVKTSTLYSSEVVEKVMFVRPEHVPSPTSLISFIGDRSDLFNAFSNALSQAYGAEWLNKIIRSTRIFNSSYSNVDGIEYLQRILLLVTAFEALLDEDISTQRKFGDALVKSIGFPGENPNNDGLFRFGKKLYEVRSKYTHGQVIKPTQYAHHSMFGDIFKCGAYAYGLLLKSILRDKGYLNDYSDIFIKRSSELSFGLYQMMRNTRPKQSEE